MNILAWTIPSPIEGEGMDGGDTPHFDPLPQGERRLNRFVFFFVGLTGLIAMACGQGTYPLDIFYEMHYQQTYKSGEPPRLAGVEGAVPVDWGAAPKSTSFNTGQYLFGVNCSICHGQDAKGKGPVLQKMRESYGYTPVIDPPDLTRKPKAAIMGILQSVTRPFGPDSVMPPFAKLLTGWEIEAIAEYISTELAVAAPPTGAPAATKAPAAPTVPGALQISADGDSLKFDQSQLPEVSTGTEVVLVFNNVSGINQHNWVLVPSGTKDAVAQRGVTAGPQNGWLQPGDPDVIASTDLLGPGETGEIRFIAPAPGSYQFLCSFPGHAATMFGEFVVVP